jgi:phosphocarrier protein HPr
MSNDRNPDKEILAKGKFKVRNDKGLHSIPSTEIVKCATSFKSQVFLIYKNQEVNAKSLLSILMLAAAKGANIWVEAKGVDAQEAVTTIINLANNKFYMSY